LGPTRCRNPKRVPHSSPIGFAERTDEDERRLIETLRRRRPHASGAEEARERRSGEIPVKVFANGPGRAKPKGATSGRRTKHASGRQGLSEGSKPRNRSSSSRPLCFGTRVYRRVNGMWVHPSRKRRGYLSRGEGSEGRIPGALPVRNKTGTASKGVNRQEGDQTLKAERDGQQRP
jgi:hypothetical protein